uniref:HAT C-terminal dimerisation domain-containing protein n=1 Tax=Cajanus cajan TaxID=3821 RepID=A0A151QWC7_CAJCA|nr:hypothetical protein KK1_044500 [Cajanus cajan]
MPNTTLCSINPRAYSRKHKGRFSVSCSSSESYDIVIVGAGVIGLTIARHFLLSSDLSVAIVDKAVPCSGATGAGQGHLWMINKTPGSATWDLAWRSHQLWKTLAQSLEEHGLDPEVELGWKQSGKILQTVRPHLFWTPCAAHCLDLMLEDIGKIPKVKRVIQRGIKLVGYIYNHTLTLNTMRKYTNKVELVRHGVTRFATTFLTLQRLHKLKANLRRMFTSDEWLQSKGAKEPKGKKATEIVLMPTFWSDVVYALKAMGPIVRVLRLVDNEKKPAMGYIYEAMERAKEAIQNSFNHNEEKYKDIFAIVDRRWDCQLHHPLHAAGYYLNPEFYYKNSTRMDADDEVVDGLFKCIDRLCENNDIVDNVHNQLAIYKRAGGRFDIPAAVRARVKMAPAEWWKMYGGHTPHLQIVAIKVLSLTCSSSGCERNWSTFEHIHSKKRSKLEHQKLQDLVFIKYNQALQERFECQDPIDPIALNEVDDNNEWMLGEENDEDEFEDDLVFDDDVLTWRDVAQASGAGEPLKYTRRQTQVNKTSTIASTSKKDKGKKVMEVLEDEDDDVEEEEEYNSNASGSDEFEGEEDFNLDEEED